MKNYIGLKLITAKPMTRIEYTELRGWVLPADEDSSDEGYLVEYLDGGTPNHKDFDGYVSWSPKEVFENAYTDMDSNELENKDYSDLEDWQIRVVKELEELTNKIVSLNSYLENNEDDLLTKQNNYMAGYAIILEKRIRSWRK